MPKENKATSGGIGFFILLTIVFITLKLCGVIAWSWWFVLSSLWMPLAIVIAIYAIVGIVAVLVSKPKNNARKR